jgi:replicative DNA helicase
MTVDAAARHLQPVNGHPAIDDDSAAQRMADVEAERAVLGQMMLSQAACDVAFETLTSGDFFLPKHGKIYANLLTLWASEEPTDPVTVAHSLAAAGELTSAEVATYLHTLVQAVPTQAGTIGHHARIVKDWSRRRRTYESGIRVTVHARDLTRPVDDVVDAAQKDLTDVAAGQHQVGPQRVSEFSDDEMRYLELVAAGEVPHGISTGIGQLDDVIGGFLPGQLVIPAGRPGMGKTVAGVGFAVAAARRGHHALVSTLEMSRRELLWRLLSRVGEINLTAFTSGRLTREDLNKAAEAKKIIDGWPLHVDEQARTMPALRAAGRRFKQRHGSLGVWFVDYLQRISSTGRAERRDLEVGGWCREFKTLAQELETTVVLAAQINRESKNRADKRPALSDLRDSGEIEQEADIVILLHRDDYYQKETHNSGEAELDIAKHRNGPTDMITVAARLHVCTFADWNTPEEPYR